MSEQCPNCLSWRFGKNNYGKKTAGVVGASAGTQAGAALGIVSGPVSATVGGIGGAVIDALLGGATGASAASIAAITSVPIPILATILINSPRKSKGEQPWLISSSKSSPLAMPLAWSGE
ncbi:membrane protein [Marinobacter similis]|uniref:Membrane protein n=1 Tax=Marinobacter similis TaxID=1420916 RepID=W5YLM5_9GAMM|nr:membrane protein [Marinobacter similis]